MLIVGNTKAYLSSLKDAELLAKNWRALAKKTKHTLVLALPTPLLSLADNPPLRAAAQDVSPLTSGAHTGEVLAQVLREDGATYVIIGHSERRDKETHEDIREKITRVLEERLTPVLCVGEKERDEEGEYTAHLREQIISALKGRTIKETASMVIAYEPVWAVGGPHALTPALLHETVIFIRKVVQDIVPEAARKIKILYGGSVDEENVHALATEGEVQGFLLGRVSVRGDDMKMLVTKLNEVPR
jgi:triosephosphate isomerase